MYIRRIVMLTFDCGSVLSCGELVKGDFHMGKVSGMSYVGIAQKMF
jgi:hypothetical protein